MTSLPAWAITGFLAFHLFAIICALATRVAAGSRYELLSQFLFLPMLSAVGLATWFGHSEELGIGIHSGVTLIVMILLAVTDLRRTHEPSTSHTLAFHS
jgi:hypothetical protein